MKTKIIKIGLVVGKGTGRELVDVLYDFSAFLSSSLPIKVQFELCQHEFYTYDSIKNYKYHEIETIVQDELQKLWDFYISFYKSGGRVIFRTAINAETLYLLRQKGFAIKVFEFELPRGSKILMMRDSAQGYYANYNYSVNENEINFAGIYSKQLFERIVNCANDLAKKNLKDFDVWVIYKHHLFANIIENWVKELLPHAKVLQPNRATQYLLGNNNIDKNLLIIGGNEVIDILQEVFVYVFRLGSRETTFSKNIYLHPSIFTLTEYQTLHGSADDIAGKGIVNPIATIRALGAILEEFGGIKSLRSRLDKAVKRTFRLKEMMKTIDYLNAIKKELSSRKL